MEQQLWREIQPWQEMKLWETGRSKAMATAISAEAKKLGQTQVHVITGAKHAFELAW